MLGRRNDSRAAQAAVQEHGATLLSRGDRLEALRQTTGGSEQRTRGAQPITTAASFQKEHRVMAPPASSLPSPLGEGSLASDPRHPPASLIISDDEDAARSVGSADTMRPLAVPERQWRPDKSSKECMRCRLVFGLFTRRHHCRSCGLIFCNGCSSTRLRYANLPAEARTCEHCVEIMKVRTDYRRRASNSGRYAGNMGGTRLPYGR